MNLHGCLLAEHLVVTVRHVDLCLAGRWRERRLLFVHYLPTTLPHFFECGKVRLSELLLCHLADSGLFARSCRRLTFINELGLFIQITNAFTLTGEVDWNRES